MDEPTPGVRVHGDESVALAIGAAAGAVMAVVQAAITGCGLLSLVPAADPSSRRGVGR